LIAALSALQNYILSEDQLIISLQSDERGTVTVRKKTAFIAQFSTEVRSSTEQNHPRARMLVRTFVGIDIGPLAEGAMRLVMCSSA
jgi:hypothetical protein